MWVGDYNRNKERRILREVNVINAVKLKPEAQLINNKNEWTYWYFNLTYCATSNKLCENL